jgi:hypothetical protein
VNQEDGSRFWEKLLRITTFVLLLGQSITHSFDFFVFIQPSDKPGEVRDRLLVPAIDLEREKEDITANCVYVLMNDR